MNIIQIIEHSHETKKAGAQTVVQKYMEYLAQHHSVHLVSFDGNSDCFSDNRTIYRKNNGHYWIWVIVSILKLVRLFRKIQPDIVHSHILELSFISYVACRLTRKKLVITAHGTDIKTMNRRKRLMLNDPRVVKIVPSEHMRAELLMKIHDE
jgi:hypothetical protein